ncbi:MAG: FCD domain-containing protein [Mesorhizobium sp.]
MTDIEGTIDILKSKSLPAAVKESISTMILRGDLAPGQKLVEMDLAARLGVSRGPVREALLGLEEAGLIRMEKNRGVFVREITAREAAELYEVRASLESLAGRTLASRLTSAHVKELRARVDEMIRSVEKSDFDTYFPQNIRFHDVIVEFSGNAKLLSVYRRVINEMNLMRRFEVQKSRALDISVAEHGKIVDALESGDKDAVTAAIESHVEGGRRRLLKMLEMTGDAAAGSR